MAKDTRLQKMLAECGIASRRKAEEMIAAGRVAVNGVRAQIGDKVDVKKDKVTVDGQRVQTVDEKMYIMVHKPRGYLTSMSDDRGRKCVSELVEELPVRLFPIGRLDKDSEGLLLMTNDGDFANLIAHPSTHVPKVYRVTVRPGVTEEQLTRLAVGVEIDGRMTAPASVRVLEQQPGRVVLEFVLHEGRNRQIRNMCEAVGLEVARLKRTAIGAVKLGMLPQGRFRDRTKCADYAPPHRKKETRRTHNARRKNKMLQIVPMAEKIEEAALLAKTEGAPDNGRVLVMTDGEETLGYVVVALEDDTLVFYGFSVSGQTDFTKAKPDPMTTFVLDTLMRSAASFGETNGMNHLRTAFPDFFDFFKQRGFTVAEDHAEAPMSLIVHYE